MRLVGVVVMVAGCASDANFGGTWHLATGSTSTSSCQIDAPDVLDGMSITFEQEGTTVTMTSRIKRLKRIGRAAMGMYWPWREIAQA